MRYLTPDTDDQQWQEDRSIPRQRYSYEISLSAETGEWIVLPAGIGDLLVSIDPSSGTGRVEYTQSSIADVDAGSAVAKPWDQGDVSAYAESIMANAVTAVRGVAGGVVTFRVSA